MAAAAEAQLRSLAEEATCPICLGYFAEPVSVQCGHTFCTPCITRYWKGVQGPYPCPQCREAPPTNALRPNRLVANIVKKLARGSPGEGPHMCTEHGEKLQLFCREDQTPICVICWESRGHRAHTVAPIRGAAREYKDKFRRSLDDLKRELENILGLQIEEAAKLKDLQKEKFKIQRERIATVFNKVQHFLEKEKCRHLSNLEEKEKKMLQKMREKVSEIDKQQVSLRGQIKEVETKCQQPDVALLKDLKSIISRFEKVSGHFKEIQKKTEKNVEEEELEEEEEEEGKESEDEEELEEEEEDEDKVEEEELEDFDKVEELELKIIETLEWRWASSYAGEVTLDPDTAHRLLVLSENRTSVRRGDRAKCLFNTLERFNPVANVLVRERLCSGRHYWEVEVGDKTRWDLGVCDESVSRKGAITLSPEKGYWAVWLRDGTYKALSSPRIPLAPSVAPRVVGLFLDYEAGRFSVYNVTDKSLLFSFTKASFPRTLRPYICPGTNDEGNNGGALRILPVTGQE